MCVALKINKPSTRCKAKGKKCAGEYNMCYFLTFFSIVNFFFSFIEEIHGKNALRRVNYVKRYKQATAL